MYLTQIRTPDGELHEVETDTLSEAVSFASQNAKAGDHVQVSSVLDGLCGPEVQDLILDYVEDGWKSYDDG